MIGWLAGSTAWGFLVGAILGIPVGVFMTYKRYGHALVTGAFATPRPMPSQTVPLVAGAAVIVLALPIFLAAGWDLARLGDRRRRSGPPRGSSPRY